MTILCGTVEGIVLVNVDNPKEQKSIRQRRRQLPACRRRLHLTAIAIVLNKRTDVVMTARQSRHEKRPERGSERVAVDLARNLSEAF